MQKKRVVFFLYLFTLVMTFGWILFHQVPIYITFSFLQSSANSASPIIGTLALIPLLILHMILLHSMCKKIELINCSILQFWFLFILLALMNFNQELDVLIIWEIFSLLLLLFFNIKEKEKIYGNTLLAGMISGVSVILFSSGWMFTVLSLGMIIIWAIISPRTLLIFIMGWLSVFLYVSAFFFITDQFSMNRIIDLIQIPSPDFTISSLKLFLGFLLLLLFFFMFFSFVEYKISIRKTYLCLFLIFLVSMVAFLFGEDNVIIAVAYPFGIIFNKLLQQQERKWFWWVGSIIPLLGFVIFIFIF
ncbi:MAG: hypothetical protein N2Z72_06560 [Bacteroidales bacterium]|nr:hypothetical protein [Bacteroidales bacterium]